MKALSFYQPWASLVAIGAKRWETRSWATNYRGWVAIHASKTLRYSGLADREPFRQVLAGAGYHTEEAFDLPLGCIVAMAYIRDCLQIRSFTTVTLSAQERAFGDWTPGRFMWQLTNLCRLPKPIPARGALGLWEWAQAVGFLELSGLRP